jgi:hydroxyacylglutathione hydrolase
MKVIQVYINNSLRNFNYILYSEISHEAIIFDPTDLGMILPRVNELNLKPKYLLNTHQHYDHIADNEKFLEIEGTKKLDLKDGEVFLLSPHEKIVCRYTPGHVMDHFCYFLYESDKLTGVIVGDTVFNAGVGNCKNGGNPRVLGETIKNIFVPLQDEVIIYPSHDYFLHNLNFAKTIEPDNLDVDHYAGLRKKQSLDEEFMLTTIGEEKLYNPFFRVFLNNNEEELQINNFITLRSKRDKW